MAFKKREYNHWVKFFNHMLYKCGTSPYLIKKWISEEAEKEDYECAKAMKDVFDKWFEKYKMSKVEVDKRFKDRVDKIYKS